MMHNEKLPDLGYMEQLVDDDPAAWPIAWRELRNLEPFEVKPEVESVILAEAEKAISETGTRSILHPRRFLENRWKLAIAALLFVVLAPLLVFYIGYGVSSVRSLKIVGMAGDTELVRANHTEIVRESMELLRGDRLSLADDAKLILRVGPELTFELHGPARLVILELSMDDKISLNFYLEQGNLSVVSRMDPLTEHVVWETDRNIYTMTGTIARLVVNSENETLTVLQGSFQAYDRITGVKTIVSADQKLIISMGMVGVAPKLMWLSDSEILNENPPEPDLCEAVLNELRSSCEQPLGLGEIRSVYGSIERVILKDGSILEGHVFERNGRRTIVTRCGLRTMPPACGIVVRGEK